MARLFRKSCTLWIPVIFLLIFLVLVIKLNRNINLHEPEPSWLDSASKRRQKLHPQSSNEVRECVTGNVVAVLPDLHLTPLQPLHHNARKETSSDRMKSFQRVFDSRAWGGGQNPGNMDLAASGILGQKYGMYILG